MGEMNHDEILDVKQKILFSLSPSPTLHCVELHWKPSTEVSMDRTVPLLVTFCTVNGFPEVQRHREPRDVSVMGQFNEHVLLYFYFFIMKSAGFMFFFF